jgi:penicillin amidase
MADSDALPSTYVQAHPATRRRAFPRWLRIAFRTLLSLVLLTILLIAACVLWLRGVTRAALPQMDGEVRLAGLSAPVTVRRDGHGVPHIQAANQDDLFVAQGYVTAQDRLWQMDSYRRNANGQLAEVMGARLVPHDRAQRVLGFRRAAERIYAYLSSDDRKRFDDYARGVNLYIDQHQDDLPQEFRVLHYKPKPWKGADSISVGTMMIDILDSRWDVKLAREEISAKLNNPKLEDQLYPVGSWRDHPPTGEVLDLSQPHEEPAGTPDEEDEDRTQTRVTPQDMHVNLPELRGMLGLPQCDGCVAGSNNWVISGAHTASGKPLLSNDMHLSLTEPNIWFMADLSAPGYHAAGVTLPGMPYVIAGHNEHVAWGFTALIGDVQDLYHEKLDGKGNFEDLQGNWKPLSVEREVIHVRGGADVVVEVQSTDHGPLINPMFRKPLPGPLSLKWTLYDPALNSIPLYVMNAASNWTEFSSALNDWCWPTQNAVYSDDQGHIAYHAMGKMPLRPNGLAGKPVWNKQHEWNGYIGFDDLPSAFDPPSGFLATANSRVTTDKSKYLLSLEWIDPYRTQRIYKLLQGRDKLMPKDMLAVQMDIYSEVDQELAHRFAYAIDHAQNADDRLRKAADLMRSWDGKLTTDSAAASIVDQSRYALWPIILEPKLGTNFIDYRWGEKDFVEEEIVMHGGTDWLPPGFKDWDAVLTEAVRKGMERGSAPADVRDWKYGNWHVIDIEHPLGAMLPGVGAMVGTGKLPLSGDTTTVKQVSESFGPSQRFTMDWSNVDGSTENIVLGESSNPYSAYFRDQWDAWYGGSTFALPFHEQAVAAGTTHTLRLIP